MGLKLLTAVGVLFFVFCAAAGATLWFAAAPQPAPLAGDASGGEGFSAEERKALEDLLRRHDAAEDR
jgi:hypothetical protein